MFKEALTEFIATYGRAWSLTQADAVCTELVRSHVMGGVWEMRRNLRGLTSRPMAKLLEEKIASQFTRTNGYRNLWRAIMDAICSSRSVRSVARRHKVSREDVYFIYDRLTGEQCDHMFRKAEAEEWCFDPINARQYSKLALKLKTFSKTMAYKRLQFVANYDRGICLEDFAEDLWMEGCRLLQLNWHITNEKIRLNLARRAIVNEALDLLHHHTHESRARLASVEVETDGPHRDFERFVTTLSLDRPTHADAATVQELSLHNMCVDPQNEEEARHTWEVVRVLSRGLDDRYQTYLRIISLEIIPTEFEQYVENKYCKTLEEVTLDKKRPAYWKNGRKPKHEDFVRAVNYRKLSKLACGWLQINQNDLKRHLGTRLRRLIAEQGGTDVSVFNSVGKTPNIDNMMAAAFA